MSFKLRVENIRLAREPDDTVVTLDAFLADTNGNPVTNATSGQVDIFEVRIPKSTLPGSGYLAWATARATEAIADTYDKTVQGTAQDGSPVLTLDSLAGLLVGMRVSGPGVTTGSVIQAFTSSVKAQIDNAVVRVFTGDTVSETVVVTGDLSSSSSEITNISPNTNELELLMGITGAGIKAASQITLINDSTTITMNQNAATTATGVALTFSPTSASFSITNVSPASLTEDFEGMEIEGSGIPQDTTIQQVDSSSEMQISNRATASATGVSLTLSGSVPFAFDTSTLTVDYTELQRVVDIIDFGGL